MNTSASLISGLDGLATSELSSVPNFRDVAALGPLAPRLRTGQVYRSGIPCFASLVDCQALTDRSITDVIDLRTLGELELHGTFERLGIGAQVHHLPVIITTWDAVAAATIDLADDPVRFLAAQYARMLDEGASAIVKALTVITEGRPTLVHCTAGKDRTGVVIAMLLAALGVEDGHIADDYARSEAAMVHLRSVLLEVSPYNVDQMQQQPAAYAKAPREAMMHTLSALRQQWRSPQNYLSEHGLSGDAMTELRRLLRG